METGRVGTNLCFILREPSLPPYETSVRSSGVETSTPVLSSVRVRDGFEEDKVELGVKGEDVSLGTYQKETPDGKTPGD